MRTTKQERLIRLDKQTSGLCLCPTAVVDVYCQVPYWVKRAACAAGWGVTDCLKSGYSAKSRKAQRRWLKNARYG